MTKASTLGQRIRSLRTQKGLTQMKLAAGICTPSMISQVESERANPSMKMLYAIAERLDVSLDRLFDSLDVSIEAKGNYGFVKTLMHGQQYELAAEILKKLLESEGSELPQVNIHLQLAICYRNTGQVEAAERILSDMAKQVPADALLHAQALLELALIVQAKQEYEIATYHLLNALDRLRAAHLADGDLYARCVYQLAVVFHLQGRSAQAAELYRELIEQHAMMLEPKRLAHIHMKLAEAYLNQGDFARSHECAQQAHTLYQEIGNWERKTDAELQLTLLEWQQGAGQNTIDKMLAIATAFAKHSETEKCGDVYAELARVCLQEQNVADALAYAEQALHLLSNDHPAKGKVYRILAGCYLEQNDVMGYSYLLNAAVHFEHNGQFSELEETTHAICDYLREQGKHAEALERLEAYHAFVVQSMNQRGIAL